MAQYLESVGFYSFGLETVVIGAKAYELGW